MVRQQESEQFRLVYVATLIVTMTLLLLQDIALTCVDQIRDAWYPKSKWCASRGAASCGFSFRQVWDRPQN
jgi:hypothetical protein